MTIYYINPKNSLIGNLYVIFYLYFIKNIFFVNRYTRFRNWAIDTETQLKNLTKSLKDPQFAIDVLKPEFESQINSKQKEFNWLNGAGNQLIKAESQINPELAKTTESNLKEINENWNNLNGSLYKYTVELPTTILVSLNYTLFYLSLIC